MTNREIIENHLKVCRVSANSQKTNHYVVWKQSVMNHVCFTNAIVKMIEALAMYADAFEEKYESKISTDGYVGPIWYKQADSLKDLLSADIGGLDGGTCDSLINEMMRNVGFTDDEINCGI
jgi:hypothetical protein